MKNNKSQQKIIIKRNQKQQNPNGELQFAEVLWSGSPKKAGRQRGWAEKSKAGRRLSSSAAGKQQRRVLGFWAAGFS
ncbi:hypothetical protein SLEP1_g54266 [Rubroshorea leprosula]|uniref:Uncharacterized protein n=1 Tax=Rubroshorea leprosula TaxID=152421 RepID=A0AAV5MC54_9ROSI|nr:hypothetical protein SLEP1_g54266 [Rubroshorea leprosula]